MKQSFKGQKYLLYIITEYSRFLKWLVSKLKKKSVLSMTATISNAGGVSKLKNWRSFQKVAVEARIIWEFWILSMLAIQKL